MGMKRSAAFRIPSTGRLPWVTCTDPVRRKGGSASWARTGRFGMRISGRASASVWPAMTKSTSSSDTSTCSAPSVAAGSAYSLIVACSMTRCVEVTWLAMSATRVKRVPS